MAGLEPVVVFWTGWGIHVMVLLSFTVQLTLLLLADIRRRKDWALLKVAIWSAYMLADTAAIYALGHMSVVCRSPEHQLMALWAPLLLVHLGGQDNVTAYAIEDNRLWLRHLQTFGVQVAAAGYVLYVSNILSHPSELRSAAILMFMVGVLKYGERILALKCADSFASSVLSATSYDKQQVSSDSRTVGEPRRLSTPSELLTVAYSLLDVPKQMFEGPTTYVQVQINNVESNKAPHTAEYMLRVVGMQLSMMYDLLYTKAAVVNTWPGLCSRVLVSLPFTITALLALLLHLSSMSHGDKDAAAGHKRSVDVLVTSVLLVGAVVLETVSVLRAIFSKWTVLLLYGKEWHTIGNMVFSVTAVVSRAMEPLAALSGSTWPWSGSMERWDRDSKFLTSLGLGRMRQHSLFKLASHSDCSRGSKMAKRMGVEDWWDSNAYSWSTDVPPRVIDKVGQLLVSGVGEDITKSQDWNALQQRRHATRSTDWDETMEEFKEFTTTCWKMEKLKLEDTILVLHIATHAYIQWCLIYNGGSTSLSYIQWRQEQQAAAEVLANYMFFLVAARSNMLPYPVSRQTYVQLWSDAVTHLRHCTRQKLLRAILKQKEALLKGTPLQLDEDEGIGRRQGNGGETGAAAQPQAPQPSMNITLDRGCQLAAKMIHYTEQKRTLFDATEGVEDMLLNKWVEMLCYTAYWCNENSHAKHLTDGGEIMNAITLLMIYMKTGLITDYEDI